MIPITARLEATLEMRRHDPAGEEFGPDAYVFGDEFGNRCKSLRRAWEKARAAAGLGDFHLADLRYEGASQWAEAGVGTHVVSKLPGHTNLKTTLYINANEKQLHRAAKRIDQVRAGLASSLQESEKQSESTENPSEQTNPAKSLVS